MGKPEIGVTPAHLTFLDLPIAVAGPADVIQDLL